jgi:hypothetical protein
MMTRKELMRRINQVAQLRARDAYEQEKQRLKDELRQVAAGQGDVERHLDEAHRAAMAGTLRRAIGGSATSTRVAHARATPAAPGTEPRSTRAAPARRKNSRLGDG